MSNNWMNLSGPDWAALRYAEEHGIIEYTVKDSCIHYNTRYYEDGVWIDREVIYDLFNEEEI